MNKCIKHKEYFSGTFSEADEAYYLQNGFLTTNRFLTINKLKKLMKSMHNENGKMWRGT